jgi:hypothetical protein
MPGHAKCFHYQLLTDGKQLISIIPAADNDSRDVGGANERADILAAQGRTGSATWRIRKYARAAR